MTVKIEANRSPLEKELLKPKNLEKLRMFALTHMDEASPYDNSHLMQSQMFILGSLDLLHYLGYEVRKLDE